MLLEGTVGIVSSVSSYMSSGFYSIIEKFLGLGLAPIGLTARLSELLAPIISFKERLAFMGWELWSRDEIPA